MSANSADGVRAIAQNTCMRRGWGKAGVACGLIACGAVAWFAVHYVVQSRDQGTAGTVAQGLAAVLVPVAGLAVWLARRFQTGPPTIDLKQAADDLAEEVEQEWQKAALQRGMDPPWLNVRWQWRRGLSGSRNVAAGDQRTDPLPPYDRRITSDELGGR